MKITKISIARSIYLAVHASGVVDPRKEFIAQFEAEHLKEFGTAAKDNLATTYYQMLNYEREHKTGGVYRHHRGVRVGKTVAPIAIIEPAAELQDVEPITADELASLDVPETGNWKVINGEIVNYFGTRNEARDFKKASGGKIEKVA